MAGPRISLQLVDALIGVALACALGLEGPLRHGKPVSAVGIGAAVLVGACMSCRRLRPVPVFLATVGLVLGGLHFDHAAHASLVAVTLVSATVAQQGRRRVSVLVALALVPFLGLGILASGSADEGGATYVAYLLILLTAVAVGDALRSRREASVEREARAATQRRAQARELLDGHRLALARDLHDSVAHSLVAINTQAGVAVHLHRGDSDDPLIGVLREIKESSFTALAELRETLAALRISAGPEETSVLSPPRGSTAAGLSEQDLRPLARPLTVAGVDVHLAVAPELSELPGDLAGVAFRIVQESLTNVLRHAYATHVAIDVDLDVTRQAPALTISVSDNGRGAALPGRDHPRPTTGHGVRGITERVTQQGGTVSIGPLQPHGWRVLADLPLPVIVPATL